MERFSEAEINRIKIVLRHEMAMIEVSTTMPASEKVVALAELDAILQKINNPNAPHYRKD